MVPRRPCTPNMKHSCSPDSSAHPTPNTHAPPTALHTQHETLTLPDGPAHPTPNARLLSDPPQRPMVRRQGGLPTPSFWCSMYCGGVKLFPYSNPANDTARNTVTARDADQGFAMVPTCGAPEATAIIRPIGRGRPPVDSCCTTTTPSAKRKLHRMRMGAQEEVAVASGRMNEQ